MHITDDCVACGICEEDCPIGAIVAKKGTGYAQMTIEQDKCVNCKKCLKIDCSGEAIKEN